MLMTMMMFLLSMFVLNSHPLLLSFLLMVFSFLYGVVVAVGSNSSWLAYMLIMVFLSGMMIIIMYMTSLSSNDNIVINPFILFISMSLSLMLFFAQKMNIFSAQTTDKPSSYFSLNSFDIVFKTYSGVLSEMTIALIFYLLIVLIVAVKILLLNKGPLKMTKTL